MPRFRFSRYRVLAQAPDAPWFSLAGWFGRLPRGAMSLGVLLLVASRSGSFALAGAVSAAYVVGLSVSGPLWSRAMDRWGQAVVLRAGVATLTTATVVLVACIEAGLPTAVWLFAAAAVGASAPDVGSAVRARWSAHPDPDSRHAAFAIESTVDESLFVIAPPIITVMAAACGAQWAIAAAAGAGAAGMLALSLLRRSAPPRSPVGRRVALRPTADVLAVAASCVGVGTMFGAFDVTSIAWGDRLGLPWAGGVMMAALGIGNTLGALGYGTLHLLAGAVARWLRCALLVGLAAFALPLVAISYPLALVVATLVGMLVGPLIVSSFAVVESRSPRDRVTELLAYPALGMGIGLPLGSVLAGVAVDTRGIAEGFMVMAVGAASVVIVGGLGEWALRGVAARRRRRAAGSATA